MKILAQTGSQFQHFFLEKHPFSLPCDGLYFNTEFIYFDIIREKPEIDKEAKIIKLLVLYVPLVHLNINVYI